MMAKKSLLIAFTHGGKLPAAVMGTKDDVPVPPLEPVAVPYDYGRQLVDDRFAYLVDEKEEKAKRDAAAAQRKAAAVESAEAAVEAAQKKLDDAADDDAREEAKAGLSAAEADLEKAKAA